MGSLSFPRPGRFDVVDIVEANDPKQIEQAAVIIRASGHSATETLVVTPWKEFLNVLWRLAKETRGRASRASDSLASNRRSSLKGHRGGLG